MQSDIFTITYNIPAGAYFIGATNPIEFNTQTDTFTLNNPVMDGYNFDGWTGTNGINPETEVIIHKGTTTNLEYTANFTPIEYSISYDLDGGSIDPNTPNQNTYTIESSAITLYEPTKDGYEFTGWTGTGLSQPTKNVTIPAHSTGSRSYTANYQIITYELNIEYNGGALDPSESNPDHYDITDEITLAKPIKEGYTFAGWKIVGTETVLDDVTISHETGNKSYEATYTPNHYTVVFHANYENPTGSMNPQEFTYDVEQTLTPLGYEREGYLFLGWTTNDDGTGTGFNDKEAITNLIPSGSIDLYANWRKIKISILISGQDFNTRIKTVAGSYANVHKIKYSPDVPTEVMENYGTSRVSISARSDEATYIWYDSSSHTLYYGGAADIIYLNESAYKMFSGMNNLTEVEVHFSTENTTSFEQMFNNDYSLTTVDLSKFNTSSATTMKSMFTQCRAMEHYNINNWDVSHVKNFQHMFNSNWKVQELDLSNWHTDAAENMGNMFSSTREMAYLKIDNFNTSKVTNLHGFCNDSFTVEELDFSMMNFKSVKDLSGFISNDHSLKNVIMPTNPEGTPKLTNTSTMFMNCENLETIDVTGLNTSNVNTIGNMFDGDTSLTTIYANSNFVLNGFGASTQMFFGDTSLVGGDGTKYTDMPESNRHTIVYAKIDNQQDNIQGYFTRKP